MATEPVLSLRTREYDELRRLLRETREQAGLSQEELSRRLGRSITYMGKIELGTRRLDIIEFIAIVKTIQTEPAALVAELVKRIDAKARS